MTDYTIFENALTRLKAYHGIDLDRQQISDDPDLGEAGHLALVKAFEMCYEALLKALHRHLAHDIGMTDIAKDAKSILEAADRHGLLGDGMKRWLEYANAHNAASQDFDLKKLGTIVESIPAFLADASRLYETMKAGTVEEQAAGSATCNEIDKIDLKEAHYQIVQGLLKKYLPETEVWAFGSRVTFKSMRTSDLDLVVFADDSQLGQICDLREAFEESDLPFEVDVLVWDRIPEHFKPNIRRTYYVMQRKP